MSETESDDLPSGWALKSLDSVVRFNPGAGSDSNFPDDRIVHFLPMKAIGAGDGRIDLSETKLLSSVRKGYTSMKEGDLIFAKITPCMENGKIAHLRELPHGIAFGSTEFVVIRPSEGIGGEFLLFFLLQRSFRKEAQEHMTGTAGQLRVPVSFLKEYLIPLPPLAEQHRIVAKLEELFSELDAGVAALRRAQRRLARYRQSLLQAAVTGELTREWREQQSHDVKLGKLDSQAGWPLGWQICKVADLLSEPLCNGLSIKEATSPTEVRALKLNAMGERGFNYSEYRYLPITWSEVEDLEIKPGDLFVCRGNGSLRLVGRSVLAQAPPFPVIFPDTMIRLRVKDSLGSWVNSIWPSRQIRNQIESSVKTTAGIWKINQGELENIEVPIPSASERAVILAELDRRLSAADALEATFQASLRRAERLRQSILERAFRGELVPQDPHDEPAEALLARLKATAPDIPAPRRRGRPPKAEPAEPQAPRRRGRPRKAAPLASGGSA